MTVPLGKTREIGLSDYGGKDTGKGPLAFAASALLRRHCPSDLNLSRISLSSFQGPGQIRKSGKWVFGESNNLGQM